MTRAAFLSIVFALPVLLANQGAVKKGTDPLPVGSFWVGCGHQDGKKGEKEEAVISWGGMALHIDEREGKFFRASVWYPGINNGVSRMNGMLDGEGGVSFEETSILFGQATKNARGLVSGGRWTGRLDAKTLTVLGSFSDPQSGATIPSGFSLARAHTP